MPSATYSGASGRPQTEDAPPAYRNATGPDDLRQEGLSTQTQMRDDGRIDIHINEADKHLARQIEQVQLAARHEEPATPPASAHTSSRLDAEPAGPPPPLNIVIQVVGSRGDVQPFVALGKELANKYRHRVRLATHGTFKKFVEENGLEFFDIGGDPTALMAFMVKNPGLIPGMRSLKDGDVGKRRKDMAEILQGCWRSCADSDEANGDEGSPRKVKPFVAHAIIANPPSYAHIHCAQKLGVPLHLMFTMPWSPTHEFPHPLANIKSSNASGSMTNEMSYTVVDIMTWQGLGDLTNKFRQETLDLGKITQAAAISALHRLQIPYTYCWSPALIPKPKDWSPNISISGFYFLSLASNYRPEADLAEFLASGPPPVYIGFGSIVVDDPEAMTKLIFEAVKKTGQRALVSKGWGGLGGSELGKPDGVFMLGNCPHDWLFQHVSCVVHHGGAGTMAAGIALGRPTVIVPFFGDQPFWGAMIARAGAGPLPIPYKQLTPERLSAAILEALRPETLERARELGEHIREEKGCEAGAASFHARLNVERLRCSIAPTRAAVWQVRTKGSKKDGIKLSAFAATVLGNEGVLDVNQLRLYRPCEHAVDELVVVSNLNGPNPILSTLGSVASAVINFPIDVGKAYAGVVTKPYQGAKADGWRGFGKGLGKGLIGLLPRRGIVVHGTAYGIRALYLAIHKRIGSDTLSFILAAHFAQGFEDVKTSTEEERSDVLKRWRVLSPVLEREQSGPGTILIEFKASVHPRQDMSFGVGVGDILAVSKLALGIWGRVRDSSDQFKAIRGEAAGLKIVLDDLAEQVSNGQLGSQQITQLSTLVEGCRKVLEDLDVKVKKYDSLDVHTPGLGAKTERVWKKLKWDPSEIDALRLRIISNIASLEAFNAGIASRSSHVTNQKIDILDDHVKSLHLDIEHKDRQAILDWLSSSNFPAQQATLSSGRQGGTGSWLIESKEFKTWTEAGGGTLICQGIPGAGKTMLASLVIDHLKETLCSGSSGVIYTYCDYRMQQEQTLSGLIASLLKQTLQQQQVVPTDLKEACQGHIRAGTRPKVQEMLNMLQTAMESFSRTYVIVDALDELSSQDQVRQNLLKELRGLQDVHEYNLLITSRHIPNLTLEFPEPLCLEIRASPEDVRRYVYGHMTQLSNCVKTSMGLQESIASSVVAAVDGMFLLAQLHLDSLKDQTSPKAIKRTLLDLPKGFKDLGRAYKGAMQRIDDQLEGFRSLAKQVLGWLTYAERLMSITELQHAIAIELGERELDEDNLVDPGELVSVCAGLVVVDDQSSAVRLVHYTTQEYFEQHGDSLLPGAPQTIAESCLTYLLYDDFATGWLYKQENELDSVSIVVDNDDTTIIPSYDNSHFPEAVESRLRNHPFYTYAAQYWAMHATDGVQYRAEKLLLEFVKDDTKVSSAAQVLMLLSEDPYMALCDWDESRSPKPVSAMHLLSYLGAEKLISILLDQGFEADTRDLNTATPLWWAACSGDVEVVKLLVGREDVDINACNRQGGTPLSQAVEEGHSAVVELLLSRKDINTGTSLLRARSYGPTDILRRLLERDDVNVNMVNENGETALSEAAISGWPDSVATLLARADININSVDKRGKTPLILAAIYGHTAVVELLLSHGGVNVNIGADRGGTALLEAAISGHGDVVKLLLAYATIDLDLEDREGRSILTQVEEEQKDFENFYGIQHDQLEFLRVALKERSLRR